MSLGGRDYGRATGRGRRVGEEWSGDKEEEIK